MNGIASLVSFLYVCLQYAERLQKLILIFHLHVPENVSLGGFCYKCGLWMCEKRFSSPWEELGQDEFLIAMKFNL